jgi:hypothetical protein
MDSPRNVARMAEMTSAAEASFRRYALTPARTASRNCSDSSFMPMRTVLISGLLLLDCPEALKEKLLREGFDVEAGTVGMCTGARRLPSQVYEKDIIFLQS